MKILIVEDEKDIGLFLKSNLETAGFNVEFTQSGERGSLLAKTHDYDLIILDLNIPDRNGFEICQDIRTEGKEVPIIILTVETEIGSKVQLLNAGADDYLTKPFSVSELLARIRSLLRRPKKLIKNIISFNGFQLDNKKQIIIKGDKEIYLTRKEFILLEYLLLNRHRIVSRGELVEHVWDQEASIFSNTIETHILNLRKKLSGKNNKSIIKTYSGRGYGIE